MNIREKEKYIEDLKAALESIRYPKNPFKDYVLIPEYYDSGINGAESPVYIANADKAYKIARSLTTDITDD